MTIVYVWAYKSDVAASNKWCRRSSHLLWWNSAGISHHSGWVVVIVVRMEVCKIQALKSVATSLKASITVVLMSSVDQICQILFAHLVTWVITTSVKRLHGNIHWWLFWRESENINLLSLSPHYHLLLSNTKPHENVLHAVLFLSGYYTVLAQSSWKLVLKLFLEDSKHCPWDIVNKPYRI